jgi:hypothetical protein
MLMTVLYILASTVILTALFPLNWFWYNWLGAQVDVANIGFGKLLWTKEVKATRWNLKMFFMTGDSFELRGMEDYFEGKAIDPKAFNDPKDFRLLPAWKRYLLGAGGLLLMLVPGMLISGPLAPFQALLAFPAKLIEIVVEGGTAAFWTHAKVYADAGFIPFFGKFCCWIFAMQFFPFSGTFVTGVLRIFFMEQFRMEPESKPFQALAFVGLGLVAALLLLLLLSLLGIWG